MVPSPPGPVSGPQFPPDLARVVAARDRLPGVIKTGVLALVQAAGELDGKPCLRPDRLRLRTSRRCRQCQPIQRLPLADMTEHVFQQCEAWWGDGVPDPFPTLAGQRYLGAWRGARPEEKLGRAPFRARPK